MEAKYHFVMDHHLASFIRSDEVPGLWLFGFWVPGVDGDLEQHREQKSGRQRDSREKHSVWEVRGDREAQFCS